jgi:hypothetical protein
MHIPIAVGSVPIPVESIGTERVGIEADADPCRLCVTSKARYGMIAWLRRRLEGLVKEGA